MKKMNYKTGLLAIFIGMSSVFTSCINNEDTDNYVYTPLTQIEKTNQINSMAGTYTGKARLYVSNGYNLTKADSADINLIVGTDSTLRVSNFPLRLLSADLSDATLKTAVSTQTAVFNSDITLYKPYKVEEMTSSYKNYCFFSLWDNTNASGQQTWNLQLPYTYNGATENVQVEFSTQYATGHPALGLNTYNISNRSIICYLVPQSITWGSTMPSDYNNGIIIITATK